MDLDFMVHLEDLSLDELKRLVDNEEKINEFIMDEERLKRVKLDREMIMAENRSIADDNLGKEPKLLQLKSDLRLKYPMLKEHHETFQTNQVKMASTTKEENLDSMLAVLQARSAESEERTEVLVEMLNTKEIEINDFISEFKTIRKVAHLRRAKVDKLKELILELRRNGVHSPAPYPAVPQAAPRSRQGSNSVSVQSANNTPYPGHQSAHGTPSYPHPPTNQPSPLPQQAYQPHAQQYTQYNW